MRAWLLGVALLVGCGGSSPGSGEVVVDLAPSAQESLCEAFLDEICDDAVVGQFCDDPCIRDGCGAAVEAGAVTDECPSPITVGDVNACASSADLEVCQEGGGCMFDALEAICP